MTTSSENVQLEFNDPSAGFVPVLKAYEEFVASMKFWPARYSLVYPSLGLASEAGEVAGKVKKILRDRDGEVDREAALAILKELGDVQYYVVAVAADLGFTFEQILQENVRKLTDRANRGTLSGDGDNR